MAKKKVTKKRATKKKVVKQTEVKKTEAKVQATPTISDRQHFFIEHGKHARQQREDFAKRFPRKGE